MDRSKKTALLVIDVQENLVNPQSRLHIDTRGLQLFFTNLNRCIQTFKDAGLPVLYITNEWTNPILNWLTGNVCKAGAPGTGIDPRVLRINDRQYKKSRNNALSSPQIWESLEKEKTEEVYLVGLFAEHCIKATAVAAKSKGLHVNVIADAIGSKNEATLEKAIRSYQSVGVIIMETADLIKTSL